MLGRSSVIGMAAALLTPLAADAATMRATFSGRAVVTDCGGLFAAAPNAQAGCSSGGLGGFFSDEPFALAILYDTGLGSPIPGDPSGLWGGAHLDARSPILAASFTAAGSTIDVAPLAYGLVAYGGEALSFSIVGNENGADDPLNTGDIVWAWQVTFARDGVPAPSFRDPFDGDGLSGGLLTFRERMNHPTGYTDGDAYLTVTHLTISLVPEPSTWGLLIVGFGLVGGSMRGRRSRAASCLSVGSHSEETP